MKEKIKIPKYMDFPEYAEQAGKMETLKKNHNELINKKIEMSHVNSEHDSAVRLRGESIENLIESGSFEDVKTGTKYTPDDFAKINSQIHMLVQAINKHQVTLDRLKNKVNPKLLKDVKSKYSTLVKKITEAYVELAILHEEENDIINALEDEEIRYWGVMPRVLSSNIGFPSNEHAWIHFYLKEAEAQGYIKANNYLK